jgi:hypothetical protein
MSKLRQSPPPRIISIAFERLTKKQCRGGCSGSAPLRFKTERRRSLAGTLTVVVGVIIVGGWIRQQLRVPNTRFEDIHNVLRVATTRVAARVAANR